MRILVATTYTIPAFSGGWTTPLDLFGDRHRAMYVVRNFPQGARMIENVKCVGVGSICGLEKVWRRGERYRHALVQKLFRIALKKHFRDFRADFVLCLDPEAGFAAMEAGLPYAMRFHSRLHPDHMGRGFRKLLDNAVFNISGPTTGAEGVEEIPHNQDLSRFIYREHDKPEKAVLLTSIDDVHEPEVFLDGIMASRSMTGDIVGTGPARKRIARLCRSTGGRVRCLPPVPRLKVPELLSNYQVGVATVQRIAPVVYQMKVNAYMASGLYTLVKPWTHIAQEAPELVGSFATAEELASRFDELCEQWPRTLEKRRKANRWIRENYSVDIPRKRFDQILSERFSL